MTIRHILGHLGELLTVTEDFCGDEWNPSEQEPVLRLTHPHGGYEGPDGRLLDAPDVSIELDRAQVAFLTRIFQSWLEATNKEN